METMELTVDPGRSLSRSTVHAHDRSMERHARVGGTAAGNAKAQADGWQAILVFFDEVLSAH
jgi:hypothetical protein